MTLSRHTILVASLLLFLGVVNGMWLYHDHSIPAWDDAYYLTNSLRTFDALTDHGVLGFSRQFLSGMSTKPPLIAALPTPIYLIVGRHPRAALLVNFGFLLVTLGATYLLARSLGDRTAALIALCVVGTMPMVYGLSRIFLVECGLGALVTLALCLLAREGPEVSWTLPVFGAIFGLGLLMKTSFPVYVAAPVVWLLFRSGGATVSRGQIAAFVIPVLMIAGPWYFINGPAALQTAVAAGSAETARVYQTGGLAETGEYLVNLMNCGPRLYFLAIPILLLLGIGRIRGVLFCLVAILPIVFLCFSHYRDLRYAAPLFPVIAVIIGLLAAAAISRFPASTIVVVLLLAAGTADMLDATFGFAAKRFQAGGLLLSIPRFSYVRSPQRTPSPYRNLLSELQTRDQWKPGVPHRLVLGSDTVTVNADTLILTALAARIPMEIATTAYVPPGLLPQLLSAASYFAYVDNAADSPFNSAGRDAISLVRADPRFREFTSLALPDGSRLRVLEAGLPAAGARSLQAETSTVRIIKFAEGIELTGLSLERVPGGLEAVYRWHSWARVPRNYWSFGHILDAQGKILAYLDHPILAQTPPAQWEDGASMIERVVIPIPSGAPQSVRLGVFDRRSGVRVQVLSSQFPLADNGTSTVAPVH